jgi:hypothetical protein
LLAGEQDRAMGRKTAGALFAALIVVLVITVDVLFFRHHFWERLAANVGIVLVAIAFYLRFLHRR